MTMVTALAGMAVLLRGTVALDLGAPGALNKPKRPSSGGTPARKASTPAGYHTSTPAGPHNASAPARICMEGTLPADIPSTPLAMNATAFVKHPTGLTFRTYILDKTPELRQEARLKSGVWEQTEQRFIEDVFQSDPKCTRPIFIDGGAAFGYYSLLASVHNPCREVQAFNPHPQFAESMKHNILDNVKSKVLKAPKICINRLALARKEGKGMIDFGYAGHLESLGRKPVAVQITSLDAFAEKHLPSNKQILMVKLDIEGQEVGALQGATKLLQGCRVKHWAIGIHRNQTDPVVAILKRNGYQIVSSSGHGQPNDEVLAKC